MRKDTELSQDGAFVISHYSKEKAYWLDRLSGELVKSFFPFDHKEKESAAHSRGEAEIILPADLSASLIKLGTGKDHRIHMVLVTAVSVLLERYTGNTDIILGVPIYKQEQEGRFINTAVALRHDLSRAEETTFKEALLNTRKDLLDAIQHQNYPLDILVYQLELTAEDDDFPLFDVIVTMENIHDKKYIENLDCNVVFSFLRDGDAVTGKVEYNPRKYEPGTIKGVIDHFIRLLSAAVGNIALPLSSLEILTPEEKHRLLVDLNDTAVMYPKEKTLAALFADQVRKRPDSIAIIDLWSGPPAPLENRGDGTGGQSAKVPHYITYRQLDRDVNRLAVLLKEKGVRPDSIVALLVREPLNLIIGILASIAAAGAYMPLDPEFPEGRMQLMLQDSNALVLVKENRLQAGTSSEDPVDDSLQVLDIDALAARDVPGEPVSLDGDTQTDPEDLAYVLYTSGSTGGPKGVMVTNRNVARLAMNTNYMEFSENTRMLQNGSPVFDALTFEVWGTLLNGGQLVLVEKTFLLDAWKFGDAIKRYRINAMLLTPVFFNQLAQQDSGMFGGLQWLLVGGDVVSPTHINMIREVNKQINLVNAYGPTENGVISTSHLVETDVEITVPIGRPINNSTAYILDAAFRLQPVGVVGELYVGGDGVARGYMNNPQLTLEKFIHTTIEGQQLTLYKTGDLARWLPGGIIEFKSRRDYQVKIRGHRIELGEIESRLFKHGDIVDTIVVLTGDRQQATLCAYYVSDIELPPYELKDYLSEDLPLYMVPTYFIQLAKLPCTSTGKIDRKALPDPKTMKIQLRTYQPPSNAAEAAVLRIWSEVLELEPDNVSIEDVFFELGGNSINVLKVQKLLCEHFRCDISMSMLFVSPTIKSLAANIMENSLARNLQCVVKLNNGENKKNIFIFHPLNGMIYPYKELATLLESDFNVYGIQARGLTRDDPLPENFQDMLSEYLEEIQVVQEEGPYIFAGYCVGCGLAYLATTEMEDRGEEVEATVLLDIGTFWPIHRMSRFELWKLIIERRMFAAHVKRTEITSQHIGKEGNEEQKQLVNRVEENNIKILRKRFRYSRIINSPLIHVRAKENLSLALFRKTWLRMSTGGVKFSKMTGNHFNMFMSPHVEQLAQIVRENIGS
ncbi:MAG: amino acid adenylation domain-containing protein [bacterium]|nr:amino acid adenylation domain-containing protein [bacterium]